MSVDPRPVSTSSSNGVRVLAWLTAGAILAAGALPIFSGVGGQGNRLIGSNPATTVLIVALIGLVLVGGLSVNPSRAGAGLAGGAGLFVFGYEGVLLAVEGVGVASSSSYGGSTGVGAGMVSTGFAGVLGLILWLSTFGSRPRDGDRIVVRGGVGALGVIAGIVLLIGMWTPPPDVRVKWTDWAFITGYGDYGGQLNAGLTAFYVGCTISVVVGFASASRWGLWMAVGGFVPVGWIAFAWLADVNDTADGDRWSGAFKTTFHPLFGVACAAIVLLLIIGFSTSAQPTSVATALPFGNQPRWEPDPFGRAGQRFWDGRAWTEHVADAGQQRVDPPTWNTPPPPPPASAPLPSLGSTPLIRPVVPQRPAQPLSISQPVDLQPVVPQHVAPLVAPPAIVQLNVATAWSDHDNQTVVRRSSALDRWSVRLDDGVSVALGAFNLLGRDPAAGPGDPLATLVPIDDADRSVSKTHLALRTDSDGLSVVDRGSRNGTAVVREGVEVPLIAGVEVHVGDGSEVRFGDRSFVVERLAVGASK